MWSSRVQGDERSENVGQAVGFRERASASARRIAGNAAVVGAADVGTSC
jgi:hypothetical protein